MEDVLFAPSGITVNNVKALSEKISVSAERKICEIRDIAKCAAEMTKKMLDADYSAQEAISYLSDFLVPGKEEVHSFAMPENRHRLASYMKLTSEHDKASFVELFLDSLGECGINLSESDFLDVREAKESIAFVKGPLANEAYDVFSQDFENPVLKHGSDIKSCLGMLRSGEVGYCLLPFEEKGGVRLSAIRELIYKEDLKINSVTPVFGPLGDADMRYALVSKYFSNYPVCEGDDRYLELRFDTAERGELGGVLIAASVFDIGIYRVNTVNFDTERGASPSVSLVLSADSKDFAPMLVYLTLFFDDFAAVGIYKNLE